jgi:predicted lipoprotein with Yx(FWY)xxD motif
MHRAAIASVLSAILLAACAGMGGAPVKYSNDLVTSAEGMTLYTFDKDVSGSGKSVCNGQCAVNWPPFKAGSDAAPSGNWTIVSRDDGVRQWAFDGKPLYFWAKDQKSGDRTGDGFNNVWHVLKWERPATASSGY